MRRRTKVVLALCAMVVIGAAGGIWWFLRDDAPPRVSLEAAAESATGQTGTREGIAGDWSVDADSGTFDFETATGTFAGFRIEERLTGIGSTTAVGRTGEVSGKITIEGTTLIAASFEVDTASITTNDRRRDDNVASALSVTQFPNASFALTAPVELGADAADGNPIAIDATGTLTIKGVTKNVTIPIEAQLVNGTVVVIGSTDIVFSDYGVTVPRSQIVLSVEDHGVVEFQLLLQPA
ncbi:MAG TPA: YceI family protein [Acidimicrobiales bacterium]|nr:YceI family protein [Acidimicrobiales bacterium]